MSRGRAQQLRRAAAAGGLALVAAACGSSPSATSTTSSSRSTTTTEMVGPTATTATTVASAAERQAVVTAVTAYESQQGLPASHYQVTNVVVSSVDPTWARFDVQAAPAYRGSFQDFYGVARRSAGRWTVLVVGTAEVGCPPGSNVVPVPVRPSLSIVCPTTG
jgi:hypothetical protein